MEIMIPKKTAILIDGGFYRQRAYNMLGEKSPKERADELNSYCMRHLRNKKESFDLYRIFYYDCPPMDKKLYHPFLKNKLIFQNRLLTLG